MGPTSKDLLDLEQQKSSFIESAFLVCKKDPHEMKSHDSDGNAGGKLLTTTVSTSQVLGKVKDFLGIMAEANKKLQHDAQKKSRQDFDIEVLNGNETNYIEMDLILGVADLHTPEAIVAAESAIASSQPSFPSSATSSGSNLDDDGDDDDHDDDDDDDDDGNDNKSSRFSKKFENSNFERDSSSSAEQLKKRPKITELN